MKKRIFLFILALLVYLLAILNCVSLFESYVILVSILFLGYFYVIHKNARQNIDFLSNGNAWLLLGIFLIFVIAPISLKYSHESLPLVFARRDWENPYPRINLYAALAVLGVVIGHQNVLRPDPSHLLLKSAQYSKWIYSLGSISALFWIGFYLNWANSQGGLSSAVFANRAQFRAAGASATNGYGVDAIFGALGAICVLIIVSHKARPLLHNFLLFVYLLLLVPSIFSGSRSKFVFYLIVLVILKISLGMRIKAVQIVASILIVPILIVAPRLYRFDAHGLSVSYITQSYNLKYIVDTLTQEDLAMAPALAILESQRNSHGIQKLWGRSYLGAMAKPIPRALYPSKPIEFDKQLNSIIFPIESRSVGLSFSALSEPLVNFGPFGILIFFSLLGKMNSVILKRRIKLNTLTSILIHAWLTGFMFVLVRGNLTVDYQRVVFPMGTALLIVKFSSLISKERLRSPHQQTFQE